jgi:hypothetical protein
MGESKKKFECLSRDSQRKTTSFVKYHEYPKAHSLDSIVVEKKKKGLRCVKVLFRYVNVLENPFNSSTYSLFGGSGGRETI